MSHTKYRDLKAAERTQISITDNLEVTLTRQLFNVYAGVNEPRIDVVTSENLNVIREKMYQGLLDLDKLRIDVLAVVNAKITEIAAIPPEVPPE